MSSRKSRRFANPGQPAAPDTIDPESLPPPMRRAWERYREPDAMRHRPHGDGAHIYARVSDDDQAGPGRTSIDEQIRFSEKALVGTNIPIVGRWRDEGFSGVSRLSERPIGRQLFAAVKSGEIIVCYRLDRFSRNAQLGLADINELRRRGVGLLIAGDQRCAEAGATEHQLMALFGWSNPQQAAAYTKKANRAKLEAQAAVLLQAQTSNKSVPLFAAVGVRWDNRAEKAFMINGAF
jgi:hypothetical protein